MVLGSFFVGSQVWAAVSKDAGMLETGLGAQASRGQSRSTGIHMSPGGFVEMLWFPHSRCQLVRHARGHRSVSGGGMKPPVLVRPNRPTQAGCERTVADVSDDYNHGQLAQTTRLSSSALAG